MKINSSYTAALAILGTVIVLFTLGTVVQGGADGNREPVADTASQFEVVTRAVTAEMRPAILSLRGRTQAAREVVSRAETGGRVAATPAVEGSRVTQGDVLCRLEVDARAAALEQAEAELRSRQLEFDAATELVARGHRSSNQAAAAEAARDAARARLAAAREELANIHIRAPFDGYFDFREAEIGDYLAPGQPCGTVIELDPVLIVAQVAERNVGSLETGMTGRARLVTGETTDGTVRFIRRRADPATRTFRMELEAPNPDGRIRSGVTAEIRLELEPQPAHQIPASILALNAAGELGVRIVDEASVVRFVPVELIDDTGEHVWVSGLPERAQIIVRGQDFVAEGVEVSVIREGARP